MGNITKMGNFRAKVKKLEGQNVDWASSWVSTENGLEEERDRELASHVFSE